VTLILWLVGLMCDAKPHLLAVTPVGYATPGGAPWLTAAAPVAAVGAAYYPAYASYAYTPVYYGSYAAYPAYYPYLRR
ncbi:GH19658, partial [Drosophila grimshawi]